MAQHFRTATIIISVLTAIVSLVGGVVMQGQLALAVPATATQLDAKLGEVLAVRTQYTDGGPALPGLAVLADGRFIPLDQLGSAELALEVLRWERIPASAEACIVIRG